MPHQLLSAVGDVAGEAGGLALVVLALATAHHYRMRWLARPTRTDRAFARSHRIAL